MAFMDMDLIISTRKHLKCRYVACVYVYVKDIDEYMLIIIVKYLSRFSEI